MNEIEEAIEAYQERTAENTNKIAAFKVKQCMPYDFKVRYAKIRIDEFIRECGFGIHMEKRPHRFDYLRKRNPDEWEFWMKHCCKDSDGNLYGWGRVLDYIGVGWEEELIM